MVYIKKELSERNHEGWICRLCSYTEKGSYGLNMSDHVETHMDALVNRCNEEGCSEVLRSRNQLKNHQNRVHKANKAMKKGD